MMRVSARDDNERRPLETGRAPQAARAEMELPAQHSVEAVVARTAATALAPSGEGAWNVSCHAALFELPLEPRTDARRAR